MELWLVIGVLALFLGLMFARVPIAFALGIAGAVGIIILQGLSIAGSTVARITYSTVADIGLIVIPLFVLMGSLAAHARIASDSYTVLARFGSKIEGSIGVATVFASAAFAAVTGSSAATVAALGRTSIGEMVRHGYTKHFAAGIIAVAGTLGVLIPPSMMLVLYGIVSGEPIGSLFIAGIIPGIISAVAYATAIVLLVKFLPRFSIVDPDHGPGAKSRTTNLMTKPAPAEPKANITDSPFVGLAGAAMIFVIVIGGVFAGVFTVTESAAIGALALTVFLFARSGRDYKWAAKRYLDSAKETASTTGMIFAVLIGASIFTFFLVQARVPQSFAKWAMDLDAPPLLIVGVMLLVFLPLGAILDGISALLIIVPLAYPVVVDGLGFDGIWFGVLVVMMLEIGFITPPVGLNVYVAAGVAKMPVENVFKGVTPFFFVMLTITATVFFVPSLATGLPALMQ